MLKLGDDIAGRSGRSRTGCPIEAENLARIEAPSQDDFAGAAHQRVVAQPAVDPVGSVASRDAVGQFVAGAIDGADVRQAPARSRDGGR